MGFDTNNIATITIHNKIVFRKHNSVKSNSYTYADCTYAEYISKILSSDNAISSFIMKS